MLLVVIIERLKRSKIDTKVILEKEKEKEKKRLTNFALKIRREEMALTS